MLNNKTAFILSLTLAITFTSCKNLTEIYPKKNIEVVTQPDNSSTSNIANNAVDNWVYDQMKTYYLWESQMADKTKTNLALPADKYFESILVSPGVVDRFSWIQESAEELTASLNGVNKVLGIRYTPISADVAKTKTAMSVVYALKGSPADKAGIKRGDFITKVNGIELTPDNYSTALAAETNTLTLGEFNNGKNSDRY
jgi:C-terminal processing protease CtpA/Prc